MHFYHKYLNTYSTLRKELDRAEKLMMMKRYSENTIECVSYIYARAHSRKEGTYFFADFWD